MSEAAKFDPEVITRITKELDAAMKTEERLCESARIADSEWRSAQTRVRNIKIALTRAVESSLDPLILHQPNHNCVERAGD